MTLRIGVDTGGTFTDFVLFDDGNGDGVRRRRCRRHPTIRRARCAPGSRRSCVRRRAASAGSSSVRPSRPTRCSSAAARVWSTWATTASRTCRSSAGSTRRSLYDLHWAQAEAAGAAARLHRCAGPDRGRRTRRSRRWMLERLRRGAARARRTARTPRSPSACCSPTSTRATSSSCARRSARCSRARASRSPTRSRPSGASTSAPARRSPTRSSSRSSSDYVDGVGAIVGETARHGAVEPARLQRRLPGRRPGAPRARRSCCSPASPAASSAPRSTLARPGMTSVFSLDMGGTSCDIGLDARRAQQQYANEFDLAFGLPVSIPCVAVSTIGAGGGSIAWIDRGGLLHVGPRSAGRGPGPVAYGHGGTEPTVTDANLRARPARPRVLPRRGDGARRRGGGRARSPSSPTRLGIDAARVRRSRSPTPPTRTWPTRSG